MGTRQCVVSGWSKIMYWKNFYKLRSTEIDHVVTLNCPKATSTIVLPHVILLHQAFFWKSLFSPRDPTLSKVAINLWVPLYNQDNSQCCTPASLDAEWPSTHPSILSLHLVPASSPARDHSVCSPHLWLTTSRRPLWSAGRGRHYTLWNRVSGAFMITCSLCCIWEAGEGGEGGLGWMRWGREVEEV